MQAQRELKRRRIDRLYCLGFATAVIAIAAGCGSESTADAAAGAAAQKQAAAPTAGTASTTPTVSANAALSPLALSAWEKFAGCRAKEARAVPSRWAPYPGARKDETVVDLFGRHFSKYSGGFISADFNSDAKPDFIVIAPSGCEVHDPNERMDYGSRGGPAADFVISTASGYSVIEGFHSFIDASMKKPRGNRDVLEINGPGWNGSCGYVQTAIWGWTGTKMDVIERRDDKGKLVDKDGCPVRTQAAAAGSARFPPIPAGYYAIGSSCARAIANFESDPFGLTLIDEQKMLTAGMLLHEITKLEAMGANRFRFRLRTEGEDGNMHADDMVIAVTGPSSFVRERSAPPMGNHTHCPDNSVPKSIRDQFTNYGS